MSHSPHDVNDLISRAEAHFDLGQFEDATADVLKAIRLNPGDVGQDYEPSTGRSLSTEALKHGEEQVRRMLADRPEMAKYVQPGEELWTWAVRKFAGEDLGLLVDWDPADPHPFKGECRPAHGNQHGAIRIEQREPGEVENSWYAFNESWAVGVLELHNLANSAEFSRITDSVRAGQISQEAYILAYLRAERTAVEKTRAFYLKLFLPWSKNNGLQRAFPREWRCTDFVERDALESMWRTWPHWDHFAADYDLLCVDREFRRGEYASAEVPLKRLRERKDVLARDQLFKLHFAQGYFHLTKREPHRAIPEFAAALAIEPASRDAALMRATALRSAGSIDESLDALNALVKDHADWPPAYRARSNYYRVRGDTKAAIEDMNTAIRLFPHDAALYVQRGKLWRAQGNFHRAAEDFSEAVRLAPGDADGYFARGGIYHALSDWGRALEDYSAAIRLDPKNSIFYLNRAKAYAREKRYQQAWTDVVQAIEFDPNNPVAYRIRAQMSMHGPADLTRSGPTAVEDARKSCELTDWKSAGYIELLAEAYAASGDEVAANRWKAKAAELRASRKPGETKPTADDSWHSPTQSRRIHAGE